MNRRALAVAALVLAASATAHADTRLSFTTEDGGVSQFSIKGDRIRVEDKGDDVISLFDATARELIVIEPAGRRYYRMDAERMKQQGRQVSEQMRQMREQMEQQLENLPEEQREMMREQMEQMMQSQMPEGQGAPAEVRLERGGRGSVAGVACERVTVYADGSVAQRLCIADAGSLDMSESDMNTLRSVFSMLAEMAASFGDAADMDAPAPAQVLDEFGGVPIEGLDAQGNVEWRLQSVDRGGLDAAAFRVPAGYKEVDPMSMGMDQ